jgi:hypothetical protein
MVGLASDGVIRRVSSGSSGKRRQTAPKYNLLIISCLVFLFIFSMNRPAEAMHITKYSIEISLLDNAKVTAKFICQDDKRFCRMTVPDEVGNVRRSLDVIAFFEPGNAYFMFSVNNTFLRVGDQSFFLMPIGASGTQESRVPLYEPLPAALDQDNQSSITPPVLRFSTTILAVLKITIHALESYSCDRPKTSH